MMGSTDGRPLRDQLAGEEAALGDAGGLKRQQKAQEQEERAPEEAAEVARVDDVVAIESRAGAGRAAEVAEREQRAGSETAETEANMEQQSLTLLTAAQPVLSGRLPVDHRKQTNFQFHGFPKGPQHSRQKFLFRVIGRQLLLHAFPQAGVCFFNFGIP